MKTVTPNNILFGDCLEILPMIPDGSIDMILCDLPYGITACKWDTVIPFKQLWEEYERIIKPHGAIVLTAAHPFTAMLVMSNLRLFRYALVWDKVNKYTGALNANKMPMRRHEDILVFYKHLPTYNKQYRICKPFKGIKNSGHGEHIRNGNIPKRRFRFQDGKHGNPYSILSIPAQVNNALGLHPTQKPVALFEYLIKTYSNEDDLVLDNCAGSMTTAIACLNANRRYICIEKDLDYYKTGKNRVEKRIIASTIRSNTRESL